MAFTTLLPSSLAFTHFCIFSLLFLSNLDPNGNNAFVGDNMHGEEVVEEKLDKAGAGVGGGSNAIKELIAPATATGSTQPPPLKETKEQPITGGNLPSFSTATHLPVVSPIPARLSFTTVNEDVRLLSASSQSKSTAVTCEGAIDDASCLLTSTGKTCKFQ